AAYQARSKSTRPHRLSLARVMGASFRVLVQDANRPGWSRPVSIATNLVRLCVRAGTEGAVLDLPPLINPDAKDLPRLALGDHFRVHQPGALSLDMGGPRSCILQLAGEAGNVFVRDRVARPRRPERDTERRQLRAVVPLLRAQATLTAVRARVRAHMSFSSHRTASSTRQSTQAAPPRTTRKPMSANTYIAVRYHSRSSHIALAPVAGVGGIDAAHQFMPHVLPRPKHAKPG